jgi:GDP-4-dehydro-6-deoxy-D-mannose reductase
MARLQAIRVLITGATGFAGRHLVSLCSKEGCSVTGLGRRPASRVELPAELDDYEACDLLDPEQAAAAIRAAAPERVFHLAAQASVARSWEDPAKVIHDNLLSTVRLLEAVRRDAPKAKVLVAGSGEQYGPPERLPVDEAHSQRPRNPYALSKACADLAAGFQADAHDMWVTRARAFNHAGPGQADIYVAAAFARQIAEAEARDPGGAVEVVTGNLESRRDFTDVRDVVRAYWLLLEEAGPDAYNVCRGESVSAGDILAALARAARVEVRQRTDPQLVREGEVMEIRGSHEKLTEATGWMPEIPLEKTLSDTLDWWRERVAAGAAR